METLLFLVIAAFASHRITRLVTSDKLPLIAQPREAFVVRWGTYDDVRGDGLRMSISGKRTNIVMRSVAYLLTCDWCFGVWVSAGIAAVGSQFVVLPWSGPWPWILIALATASVVGFLAEREDRTEE